MNMREFSIENLKRCTALNGFNHALSSWSLSDWMTALTGELGEAANVLKKLNRVRDGIPGNKETPDELRAQFADELAELESPFTVELDRAAGVQLAGASRVELDCAACDELADSDFLGIYERALIRAVEYLRGRAHSPLRHALRERG